MSGLLDDLIPPWAKNLLVVSPYSAFWRGIQRVTRRLDKLFGTGRTARPMPPPPPPALPPATGGSGPKKEIDKLSEQIGQLQQQIAAMRTAADTTTSQSGANSQEGSRTIRGLLGDTAAADAGTQGSTPDAQAAALPPCNSRSTPSPKRQDKATNANGIADALRNLNFRHALDGNAVDGDARRRPAVGPRRHGGLGAPTSRH